MKYRCRKNFVLVRKVLAGKTKGGIIAPAASAEGMKFYVEAIGKDVEDLVVGDRVQIAAAPGEGLFFPLPREQDLILVEDKHVALVMEGEDE